MNKELNRYSGREREVHIISLINQQHKKWTKGETKYPLEYKKRDKIMFTSTRAPKNKKVFVLPF